MTPMSGLVVSAYCDVGMDRCGNVEPESDGHISKFQHRFETSDTCRTIFEMLDSITYMQSNKTTKEMMFLTLDELVETCRTMRRAPLKLNGWSITSTRDRRQVDEDGLGHERDHERNRDRPDGPRLKLQQHGVVGSGCEQAHEADHGLAAKQGHLQDLAQDRRQGRHLNFDHGLGSDEVHVHAGDNGDGQKAGAVRLGG
jgi:hypothetical protein